MQNTDPHTDAPFVVQADPVIKSLVPGYLDNRRKDLVTIEQAVAAGDFKRLRKLGHDLKGSGGAYGMAPISALGNIIETAALAADAGKIQEAARQLAAFLKRVVLPT